MRAKTIQTTLKLSIIKKLDKLIKKEEVFDTRSSYIRKLIMEHIKKIDKKGLK